MHCVFSASLIVLNLKKRRVVLALPVDFYLGCIAHRCRSMAQRKITMEINTRRGFLGKAAAIAAVVAGGSKIANAQQPAPTAPAQSGTIPGVNDSARRNSHIQNGIYYFSGTGSNDGYPKDDHMLVTDPFEKHVTRTMDALKNPSSAQARTWTALSISMFFCACRTPTPSRCRQAKARF